MKHKDRKRAKRFVKQDYRNLAFLCVIYIAAVLVYTSFTYAFGSDIDWSAQHYAFPDYFRKLFYQTHQFFPNFAPNLGAGENIYLLSYYGLYSPVILLSYLLPFVKMADYIQFSSMFLTFIGAVLFYRFLRRERLYMPDSERSSDLMAAEECSGNESIPEKVKYACFGPQMAFCLTLAYLIAAPVFYHSHRHIMFVNYLPFLILSFEAVEAWLEGRKKWALSLCTAMIIFCSWFFSVSALVAVLVYAVYRWLSINGFEFKKFMKDGLGFAGRLFIGVMMAGVLLLPTLSALLSGRGKANVSTHLADFIPRASLEYLAFSPYSLGMGVFAAATIIYFLLCKNTARRFLGIALSVCIFFPLTVYALNGTLYFDAKVMIPFIPVVVLACGEVIRDMKKLVRCETAGRFQLASCIALCLVLTSFLYDFPLYAKLALLADGVFFVIFYVLYKKKDKLIFLIAAMLAFPALAMVPINLSDTATSLASLENFTRKDYDILCDVIDEQDGIWRASIADDRKYTVNYIPTTAFYGSYLYSSTHHQAYNYFYFNVMNNENEYRNSALMTRSQNLFFESFIGNRYLISENKDTPYGYEKLAEAESVILYENHKAMPLGRTLELMSAEAFESLGNAEKMAALCFFAVKGDLTGDRKIRGKNERTAEKPELGTEEKKKTDLVKEKIKYIGTVDIPENEHIKKTHEGYHIDSKEEFDLTYELPCEIPEGHLLVVECRVDNKGKRHSDTRIIINGVRNTLTNPDWRYYNKNTDFTFVLPPERKLNMTFSDGDYRVEDFRLYTADYESCMDNESDSFIPDKNRTGGDIIEGDIDCRKDAYFLLTVPYDKGFEITVDGKTQEYECADGAFIGFEMKKGKHELRIVYHAPLLGEGKWCSLLGIILFVILFATEAGQHRKKTENTEN